MRYNTYGEFPEKPCNICSSGCPECYLWIKSSHQPSITLCWTVLFWPLLGLLLLNYALVLGHWPTLKDYWKQLCEMHYRKCKGAQETLSSLSPRALFIRKQGRNFPQVYQSRTALLLLENWFDFILWAL